MSFENRGRQDQKFMSGIPIISRYLSKNQIRYLASGSKVFKIKLVWSFRTHIEHMLWVSIGRKVQTPLLGSHESTALERPTKYPHISNISTSAHFKTIGFMFWQIIFLVLEERFDTVFKHTCNNEYNLRGINYGPMSIQRNSKYRVNSQRSNLLMFHAIFPYRARSLSVHIMYTISYCKGGCIFQMVVIP